jgi:alpha-galactosidase
MKRLTTMIGGLLVMAVQAAHAESAVSDDSATLRQWVARKFEGLAQPPQPDPGLEVLENYDSVQKNARFGKPLRLGSVKHTRGLFCHAPSRVHVRLPAPGRTFTALVGVDTNEQTSGGRGSVAFHVRVGGKEAFRSGVLREGMPAVPVTVNVAGRREFVLEVDDGGDGIACDQADWAEAKVVLADGRAIWLADLPLAASPAEAETSPPFSFTYGGQSSVDLLSKWPLERGSRRLDSRRIERTLTYTDPNTGLVVRCTGIEYQDFPTVEWTLHFRNGGSADSPILENVQALDLHLERGHYGEFLLHHFVGSPCAVNDYAPLQSVLAPNTEKRIGAAGGRPTNSDMSYFSLEAPTRQGLIIVVGWPGQWSSHWARDDGLGLRVRAGQELTHLRLHPGEEIRTPLIVLQFWNGDWVDGQNVWRRWMLAHNVPKPLGKLPEPELFGCSSHVFNEMVNANEENQTQFIDRYLEEGVKIGHYWMDAGWYYCDPVGWPKTGTWEVDAKRFPRGLRAISDHAHSKGIKTIVWFEPERVHPDTWLTQNHPEWVLGGAVGGLLDLGNPEARAWLTEHVDRLLTEQGIDLYRQDFNMDPLAHWRAEDTEERQGITEIRHVEGYLAYWDELLRRHPGMFIDSCASGGRRNDLETMRRAIPLWRTDWRCDPVGTQCHTYGLSFWIPLSGTGTEGVDRYVFRSNMVPFTNCLWDIRTKTLDYDLMRVLTRQFKQLAHYWLGDYYPLTPYSTANDTWMAWQFDRPDLGEGMVQAFRRADSSCAAMGFQLRGLDPDALYQVRNLDASRSKQLRGRDMLEKYLLVDITERPGAAVITYKRTR